MPVCSHQESLVSPVGSDWDAAFPIDKDSSRGIDQNAYPQLAVPMETGTLAVEASPPSSVTVSLTV